MMQRGLFVTGTDTGVGKTEIACALIRAAARRNVSVVGMKPVAAGARRVNGKLTNADVAALQQASTIRPQRSIVNPYLLEPAIAPHLAAREAGIALELGVILRAFRA
ncbi:MAG: dethiobiotin synthase, partial [Betaproteobacteria bacterium]